MLNDVKIITDVKEYVHNEKQFRERVHMNDVKIITDVKEYELGDDVQILLDRCWKSFETPKAAVKAWNEEHPDSPLGGSTPLKKVEELMWIGKANIYKRT